MDGVKENDVLVLLVLSNQTAEETNHLVYPIVLG